MAGAPFKPTEFTVQRIPLQTDKPPADTVGHAIGSRPARRRRSCYAALGLSSAESLAYYMVQTDRRPMIALKGLLWKMIHPNDDNGDVLRRLEAQGDSLTRPRDIDFTVVVREEDAAERFVEHFRAQGYTVSVERAGTRAEFPWDVVVVKHMRPSHQEIGDFEASLQEVADTLGGHNDGWGCITQQG